MGHKIGAIKIEAHCETCRSGVAIDPRAPGSRIERIGSMVSFIATCPENPKHEVSIDHIDGFDVPGGQSAVEYLKEAGAKSMLDQVAV